VTGAITGVLLGARFLLELALLGAAAWVGWHLLDSGWAVSLLAAVLAAALVATLWGLALSPKARLRIPLGGRLAIEIALFAVVAGGLWLTEAQAWAVALLIGEIAVLGLLLLVGHPPGPPADNVEA
jgi:hypothetical protein